MRYDVVVVGGGTAGCGLAARLSESLDRQVWLVEAGPHYGPLPEGRWPADLLDARDLARSHLWDAGGEDGRVLGGRVLGGSSSVNACMVVSGTAADYDEWGPGWSDVDLRPFLDRARGELRTAAANTDHPTAYQRGFLAHANDADLSQRRLHIGHRIVERLEIRRAHHDRQVMLAVLLCR